MTDRLKGLTVAFNKDIRDDDAQSIIDAILMIKGVVDVSTSVSNPDDYMNRMQVKNEILKKVYAVFNEL